MNKQEFLNALERSLQPASYEERMRTLAYYEELIDDRLEAGEEEADIIASLGSVDAIAQDILSSEEPYPVPQRPKERRGLTIVLLALGFPLWGPLLIVAFVLIFVFYLLLFLPILILGVLSLSCLLAALLGLVGLPFLALESGLAQGYPALLLQGGASLFLLGLSLLCAVSVVFTAKGVVKSGKVVWRALASCFRKRRNAA